MVKAMEIPRQDFRRARAMQFCAAISDVLREFIPHESQCDAHYALLKMLYDSGVDVVTDADRAQAGLPPRDNLGWTADELRIIEAIKLEAPNWPPQTATVGIKRGVEAAAKVVNKSGDVK